MRLFLGLVLLAVPGVAEAAARVAASGRYICADGSLAALSVRAYGPVLQRGGREVRLGQRWAFSGFRFTGEGLTLRGRGTEGAKTLRITQRGQPEVMCRAVPAVATPGVVTGVATYSQRIALPPGVRLRVELRDVSRADAAAPLLAASEVLPAGNQVPLHWRLDYAAGKVTPGARLSLSARITDAAGQLLWVSDTFTPVPVGAGRQHAEAEIRLVPIPLDGMRR